MELGDRVGEYTIEEYIDEGAIAEIYRATNSEGDEFALKILLARGGDVVDRLFREGKALTELQHPNLVRVKEVIEHEGAPVLVMDFVDGSTLEEWMEDETPDEDTKLGVFKQIALGIAEVHNQGMVHRDLQPANILVVEDGEAWKGVVIDFGLVKDEQHGLTRPGVTMGTPGFMAPEQITSALGADSRSDIFSLGAILYYLVCEKEPFGSDVEFEVLNNTLMCKYTSPLFVAPMVAMQTVQAIDGALKRAPGERWSTVDELLTALG